ncbi:MAG: 6,7-dimethyl-8-ribityllumazine synthase, partial [Muribaculaceae bacterium]|nr:6,7-dimethyl-8-ribityllumazine synthase [Muribaculaceae bacterium]
MRVAIVKAEWNDAVTGRLTESAVRTLRGAGLPETDIDVFEVPGAVELTFAASQLIEASLYDAVIVFGCVIRGGTPHFDYVCQSVTQGVTALNADCDIPVIFGVLTVNTLQ